MLRPDCRVLLSLQHRSIASPSMWLVVFKYRLTLGQLSAALNLTLTPTLGSTSRTPAYHPWRRFPASIWTPCLRAAYDARPFVVSAGRWHCRRERLAVLSALQHSLPASRCSASDSAACGALACRPPRKPGIRQHASKLASILPADW